jgi:hypothetical protein
MSRAGAVHASRVESVGRPRGILITLAEHAVSAGKVPEAVIEAARSFH